MLPARQIRQRADSSCSRPTKLQPLDLRVDAALKALVALGRTDLLLAAQASVMMIGDGMSRDRPRSQGHRQASLATHDLLGRIVIGVVAAAERPAVRGVIAESAFASYRDIARDRASWVSWLVPLLVSGGFDPADSLASLPPRPVFVIHGAQDRIVPIRHGEELFDRALPPKRFHRAHRSGHATPWRQEGAEFEQMLVQFFMETLEQIDRDDLRQPLVPR